MPTLKHRLANAEVILIDGATGTELEVLEVATVENAWCAMASLSNPEAVKQVHHANMVAGAEVIIANTFVCSRHVLERAGYGQHFEELNRIGIELALAARDEFVAADPAGRSVAVAASISTTAQNLEQPPTAIGIANFIDQVKIQADAGAELFALEMMRELVFTEAILDAIEPTGIPSSLGFSCELRNGVPHLIHDGMPLADALAATKDRSVELLAIMHTEVDEVDRCLDVVFETWNGPVGVYAHTGGWEPPNWVFNDMISAEDHTDACLRWIDRGVQVIGGCCGIGPKHIQHLSERLPAKLPS